MSATVPDTAASERGELVASSYRQLAEIYHDLLSREELDQVLERLVKTVRHLIPVASILIAEAHTDDAARLPADRVDERDRVGREVGHCVRPGRDGRVAQTALVVRQLISVIQIPLSSPLASMTEWTSR